MRNLIFAVAATAALATSGALVTGRAEAAVVGPPNAMRTTSGNLNMMEAIQYMYGGRRHCWYPAGWHGPGWYWCGYAFRKGFGWGGGEGWQGWRREGRREERRERRY
jgi:hypothetical protein